MAAAVLEVAALAGPGIVEGAETVGGKGRRGAGDPEFLEQPVAELEVELPLKAHVFRGLREGVGVCAGADGGGAGGVGLERLRCGEIVGRRGDGGDARGLGFGTGDHLQEGIAQVLCRGGLGNPQQDQRGGECMAHRLAP